MSKRLEPITIDSYQPLRETVCEALKCNSPKNWG